MTGTIISFNLQDRKFSATVGDAAGMNWVELWQLDSFGNKNTQLALFHLPVAPTAPMLAAQLAQTFIAIAKGEAPHRKVIVEVSGGVADVTHQPDDVEVEIIDHDNEEPEEFYKATLAQGRAALGPDPSPVEVQPPPPPGYKYYVPPDTKDVTPERRSEVLEEFRVWQNEHKLYIGSMPTIEQLNDDYLPFLTPVQKIRMRAFINRYELAESDDIPPAVTGQTEIPADVSAADLGVNAEPDMSPGNDPLGPLIDEYEAWCAEQKLPYIDAQELALHDNLTSHQRMWLREFSDRWEKAQRADIDLAF